MKTKLAVLTALAGLGMGIMPSYADPTFNYLMSPFPAMEYVSYPFAQMIEGSDGSLYGSDDVLFKINKNGSGFTTLYSYTNNPAAPWGASYSVAPLEASDGRLYFIVGDGFVDAPWSQVNSPGRLAAINKDGTGYQLFADIDCSASFIESKTDGMLYGVSSMAVAGLSSDPLDNGFANDPSANDKGKIFKINKDGTGYVEIYNFTNGVTLNPLYTSAPMVAPNGATPNSPLLEGSDGTLYGTTYYGGSTNAGQFGYFGEGEGNGVIYKINKDGTGFTVLHQFDGSEPGPNAGADVPLVELGSTLYGVRGSIAYKINEDGTGYTVLYTSPLFDLGGLTIGRDQMLYVGNSDFQAMARMDTNGNNVAYLCHDVGSFGASPIQASDGSLYGLLFNSWRDNGIAIYRIDNPGSQDTTPPVLTASDMNVEATSAAGAKVYYNITMNDNCDPYAVLLLSPTNGSLLSLGAHTINAVAYDHSGNTNTASFTVTVQDTTPPAFINITNIVMAATNTAGNIVNYSFSASDLVDGATTITYSPPNGSLLPIGTTTVTMTTFDASHNTNTGTFTVTLLDSPAVFCPTNDIVVEATNTTGTIVTFPVTVVDYFDPAPLVNINFPSGTAFPLGTNLVTISVHDITGRTNHASFNVIVRDTTKPVFPFAINNLIVEANSAAGTIWSWNITRVQNINQLAGTPFIPINVLDADPLVNVILSPTNGTLFPIGTTPVFVTAYDSSGNSNTYPRPLNIIVRDSHAPSISGATNIVVQATNLAGNIVNFSVSANDAVDPAPTLVVTPPSGTLFPIGTTTVTATAYDASHNTSIQHFTVSVVTSQTITFPQPPDVAYGAAPFTVSATASSGLPVTFSRVSGPATVSSNGVVTITGAGAVTIRATQSGDGTFSAGSSDRTFNVNRAPLTVTPASYTIVAGTASPLYLTNGVNPDMTYSGFVNGENGSTLQVHTTLSPSRPASANSVIKNYTIAIANLTDPNHVLTNYTVTQNTGVLKVTSQLNWVMQPVSVTTIQGKAVIMKAAVSGLAVGNSVSWQWYFNGNPIPGATLSSNVIASADLGNVGSYYVTAAGPVNTLTSSNAVLTVALDTNAPTAAIIYPANRGSVGSASINAYGIVSDNAQVSSVEYRLNQTNALDPWTPISTTSRPNGSYTLMYWTNAITLAVGTNVLQVRSHDFVGNVSKVMTTTFYQAASSVLTVITNELDLAQHPNDGAAGGLAPSIRATASSIGTPTNGAPLLVNRSYTVTAIIGYNEMFTNWTAISNGVDLGVVSTNPAYTFIMATNLVLSANFVHNPWVEARGTYNGLFTLPAYDTDGWDLSLSGLSTLTVTSNQLCSGKLYVDGELHTYSGKFSSQGTLNITISRAKYGQADLTVNLFAFFTPQTPTVSGTNMILGSVSDGVNTANLIADQYVWGGTVYTNANTFNMVFPGTDSVGVSALPLVVGTNGVVAGLGNMADGSTMTMTAVPNAPSLDGRLPFYGQAWTGTRVSFQTQTNPAVWITNYIAYGTAIGWLQVSGTNITGNVTWVKKALNTNVVSSAGGAFTNYYTNGFTLVNQAFAAPYVRPAPGTRIMSGWTNGLISFAGGGFALPEVQAIRVTTNNVVQLLGARSHGTNLIVLTPTNPALSKLTLALSGANGSIGTSFMSPLINNGTNVLLRGTVLQSFQGGYGYFLGTNGQSGWFQILADPDNTGW